MGEGKEVKRGEREKRKIIHKSIIRVDMRIYIYNMHYIMHMSVCMCV